MLISRQWLSEFVKLTPKVSAAEIARRLTLSTVEVEGVRARGGDLDKVVVGRVVAVEKHPNADKLKLCRVDVGEKQLQIVCGGSNVRQGMLTAVATIGAKVRWHGAGDPVELKLVEIRGVKSEGMMCGADEIGLAEMFPKKDEREIIDLGERAARSRSGDGLAKALGLSDAILDIDHKSLSHRPDLWGHYGIAREVAALFGKPLARYEPPKILGGKEMAFVVRVEDKKLCPRYMALAVSGVSVGPSPAWIQERLRAVGVRPIHNIVDITNYVMMELGQPMHAFDSEELGIKNKELRIVVRKAKDGEKLKALDGKEYQLTKDMLVIADAEKPIAIAGVMGGEESGVTEKATTVIFESATFDAVSVRKTSTALRLRSESSARFEKGQDTAQAELALRRAVELTLALCTGARVASRVADVRGRKSAKRTLRMSWDRIDGQIGALAPRQTTAQTLRSLGFEATCSAATLICTVPSWRMKDIAISEDVIEEIVRLWGYEKIPASLPSFPIAPPAKNTLRALERRVKELLAYEAGYAEVSLYSFVGRELLQRMGMDSGECLELDNPLAKDRPLLRRSLVPGLLEKVEQNLHRFHGVRLFEIGRVFLGEKETQQPQRLGCAYADKGTVIPWYPLSAALRRLFTRLGVSVRFEKGGRHAAWMHQGRSARIMANDTELGVIFEVHPSVAERLGIDARVAACELDLAKALAWKHSGVAYQPIPLYPAVMRDISFIADKNATHDELVVAMQSASPLAASIQLFDVFEGGGIPAGKKSMAFHIHYRSSDKTLEAAEADAAHAAVEATLAKQFAAEVRT